MSDKFRLVVRCGVVEKITVNGQEIEIIHSRVEARQPDFQTFEGALGIEYDIEIAVPVHSFEFVENNARLQGIIAHPRNIEIIPLLDRVELFWVRAKSVKVFHE